MEHFFMVKSKNIYTCASVLVFTCSFLSNSLFGEVQAIRTNTYDQQGTSQINESSTKESDVKRWRVSPSQPSYSISGEYLYWKTNVGDTDFVVANVNPSFAIEGAKEQIGNVKKAKFDWQSGFRLGAQIVLPFDLTGIGATYTCFSPDGTNKYHLDGGHLISTNVEHTGLSDINIAKSEINLSMQLADLFLSKKFIPSSHTFLTFYSGPAFAYLNQVWDFSFTPLSFETGTFNPLSQSWRFIGGGIRTGLDFEWFFGAGFSVLTQGSVGLIYGIYKNQFRNNLVQVEQDQNQPHANAKYKDNRLVDHIQLAFGPKWGMFFNNNLGLNLQLLYELNMWFNLHEYHRSQENTGGNGRQSYYSNAPISMQGITVKAEFNF